MTEETKRTAEERMGGTAEKVLAYAKEVMQADGNWGPLGETWLLIYYNEALALTGEGVPEGDYLLRGVGGARIRLGDASKFDLDAWMRYVADAATESPPAADDEYMKELRHYYPATPIVDLIPIFPAGTCKGVNVGVARR